MQADTLWQDPERAAELHELATLLNLASRGEGAWVFCLYASVATRQAVTRALQERVDLPFFEFTFGPGHDNPRDYLAQLPREARDQPAVVCFCDLERALERREAGGRPLALGYLDLNRDWFARQPHSLLFWVTGYGRVQAAIQAPNFWSRRNAVYDFRVAEPETRALLREGMLGELRGGGGYEDLADWRRQVQLYEKLLEEYLADETPNQTAIAGLYEKLGWLHYYVGHYEETGRLFEAQLAAAQAAGDRGGLSNAWYNQANLLQMQSRYEEAEALYRRALEAYEELESRRGVAVTQGQLAYLLRLRGDYGEAERLYRESLATKEALGDRRGVAVTQGQLADLLRLRGDYGEAERLYRESLATTEALGDRREVAVTLHNMALMRQAQGRLPEALELLTRSRDLFAQINLPQDVATVKERIAQIRQQMAESTNSE